MELFKIRLYPKDTGTFGEVITIERIPARDKDYAREKGKEYAGRLGAELESAPYVEWLASS